MGAPLSECYQFPEPASKMPGHDHSLQKLYTIEGLSNPSMVFNWICPVMPKEECLMRPWHTLSTSISWTLIGLIPTKIFSILGGPLVFLPNWTGLL